MSLSIYAVVHPIGFDIQDRCESNNRGTATQKDAPSCDPPTNTTLLGISSLSPPTLYVCETELRSVLFASLQILVCES